MDADVFLEAKRYIAAPVNRDSYRFPSTQCISIKYDTCDLVRQLKRKKCHLHFISEFSL